MKAKMIKLGTLAGIVLTILISSCSNGNSQVDNTKTLLSAQEFSDALENAEDYILLDVRTPEEYSKGHLAKAQNIDWNAADFEQQVEGLDKSKPLYIYCLGGGRSAEAAAFLKDQGYAVHELDGGILKWRAAGFAETTGATDSDGLSLAAYNKLVFDDEKLVLVDFYAPWCAPCKKMEPYLKEIEKEMGEKVKVIRIDIDQNPELTAALRIESIPELKLYREGIQIWNNIGFIGKDAVVEQLK